MLDIENRAQLPLTSAGAGCGCCSSESSSAPVTSGAVEFTVEGLTCGHCVQRVEKAVAAIEGVEAATVELVPGGRSRLIIGGRATRAAVRGAVTSAGYTLSND
nr:heavy-metal-associated domain-containing protein [Arthrobacter sp. QXT-31]